MNYLSGLFNENVSPYKFSLLRISLSLSILAEYVLLLYQRNWIDVFFNSFLMCLGLISTILFLVGYKARITSVLNYIFVFINFSFLKVWEYHLDYGFLMISFLMIFLNSGEVLSVDSRLNKSTIRKKNKYFHVFLVMFVGLAFVYLDSILYKFSSGIWMNGLGMWYPAMMPYFGNGNIDFLLNFSILLIPLGFLTVFFELTFFIFLFVRRLWFIPFIVGLGLHIGIAVTFTIVNFGLLFSSVFIILLPDSFFDNYFSKNSKYEFRDTDDICLKKSGAVLLFFFISQLFPTFTQSPYAKKLLSDNVKNSFLMRLPRAGAYHFFGITNHPVFMDNHFKNSNYVWRLVDQKTGRSDVLVNENGSPLFEMNGRVWVRFLKIMIKGYNQKTIDHMLIPNLIKAIPLYGDENTNYVFQIKRYDVPAKEFKNNMRSKINSLAWQDYGTIENSIFTKL